MLSPGIQLERSARYASNLAAWYKYFPRDQLKVVTTEELDLDPQATVSSVLAFLELGPMPPAARPPSSAYCMNGKVGMQERPLEFGKSERPEIARAGRSGASAPHRREIGRESVDNCSVSNVGKTRGSDGVFLAVRADRASTLEYLRAFFKPYNQKLYAILGRDLGWSY